jgi:manganese oxidase
MTMQWKPERAGNWLFHCHLNFHIMPHPPLGEMKASTDPSGHALHGMGGLVLGTEIRGVVANDVNARKKLRLQVDQLDSIPGDFGPAFSYSLTTTPGSPTEAGPAIIVTKDEPIAINVVNRSRDWTSVHWHGLEIESYYDGVGGYGGTPQRVTPSIAAGDSFVVKMTPPRAGTFIYHSHFDEVRQQGGGLSGAFIVTEPGRPWDPTHERVILFSTPRDSLPMPVLINGSRTTVIEMKAGETYRVRLINITLDRPTMVTSFMNGDKPLTWTTIAKDAIDLPATRVVERPAVQPISIGETYDMLLNVPAPGDYLIAARTANGRLVGSAKILVR